MPITKKTKNNNRARVSRNAEFSRMQLIITIIIIIIIIIIIAINFIYMPSVSLTVLGALQYHALQYHEKMY